LLFKSHSGSGIKFTMLSNAPRDAAGFTFFEVIAVLVLISIVSVAVLSREQGADADLPASANVLKAHLRYAQSRALNSSAAWGVAYDAETSTYWLFNSEAPGTHRPLPGEQAGDVDLGASGISIAQGDITVSFDGWGRPCSDNAGTTLLVADQHLTLKDAGGNTATLTITKNTGFIP
jgi:type II secretory pathway pseudopilin PulG